MGGDASSTLVVQPLRFLHRKGPAPGRPPVPDPAWGVFCVTMCDMNTVIWVIDYADFSLAADVEYSYSMHVIAQTFDTALEAFHLARPHAKVVSVRPINTVSTHLLVAEDSWKQINGSRP